MVWKNLKQYLNLFLFMIVFSNKEDPIAQTLTLVLLSSDLFSYDIKLQQA